MSLIKEDPNLDAPASIETLYCFVSDKPDGSFDSSNNTFEGVLDNRLDEDWIQIELHAGRTYTFTLKGSGFGEKGVQDTVLKLFNAKGEQIAFNDDKHWGVLYSELIFTAKTTGTYYLGASSYKQNPNLDHSGAYTLMVEEMSMINKITGTDGADELVGTDLEDEITGMGGDDSLHGRGGHDYLYGNDGDDSLDGGDDNDYLEGGAGADRLIGGAGEDVASYIGSPTGVTVNLHEASAMGGHAEGDEFGRMISYSNAAASNGVQEQMVPDIEHLRGSAHADRLTGDGRDNILRGGDGDDTLFGGPGGGDDSLYGEDGHDKLYGTDGDDRLWGNAGDDILSGGSGKDMLRGNAGDDMLSGDSGDDMLWGNAGDDTLSGGPGEDVLDGGAGHDTASYANSTSAVKLDLIEGKGLQGDAAGDTLKDIEGIVGSNRGDMFIMGNKVSHFHLDGGAGIDIVSYETSTIGVQIDLSDMDRFTSIERVTGSDHDDDLTGGDGLLEFLDGGKGDDELAGGAGADVLDGGEGSDLLWGGAGLDVIWGGDDDDELNGEDGPDVLHGGTGNDMLRGGAGVDVLWGDAGDDWMKGGPGFDTMHGGSGADTFVFSPTDGGEISTLLGYSDIILDFSASRHDPGHSDKIDLSGYGLSREDLADKISTQTRLFFIKETIIDLTDFGGGKIALTSIGNSVNLKEALMADLSGTDGNMELDYFIL